MAKQKETPEEKKARKEQEKIEKSKKKLELSAKAIIDNMVFSKDEQWVYYRISNTAYDFLSAEARVGSASRMINAFITLMNNRVEPLDCHMIVTSEPVEVDMWVSQMAATIKGLEPAPGYEEYVLRQAEYLKKEEFIKKNTYIGFKIAKRGELNFSNTDVFSLGVSGAVDLVKDWTTNILQFNLNDVSPKEEKETRRREKEIFEIIKSTELRPKRVTAEEILLLIKRQFYPQMPYPYLDFDYDTRIDAGDIALEVSSAIQNTFRHMRFNQLINFEGKDWEVEGYRTTLTLTKLPKFVNFPYSGIPFIYLLQKTGLPFDFYTRFTLIPKEKMKKEIEKKKKEMSDEQSNMMEGRNNLDSNLGVVASDVSEAFYDLQLLNENVGSSKDPWVNGSYKMVVTSAEEKTLKEIVSEIKNKYMNYGISLTQTIGDQADLFLEFMPGDKMRGKSHNHVTDLNYLGTSGFNYASNVGDRIQSV